MSGTGIESPASPGLQPEVRLAVWDAIVRPLLARKPLLEVAAVAVEALASHLSSRGAAYVAIDASDAVEALEVAIDRRGAGRPPLLGMRQVVRAVPGLGRALSGHAPLVLSDVAQAPLSAAARDLLVRVGVHALIAVPVLLENRPMGWLAVDDDRPRTWSTFEIEVVGEAARYLSLASAEEAAQRDRRVAEDMRRRSEEIYRTLVETSPDAILLTDPYGHILLANRHAAEMHGVGDASELLGRNALDFLQQHDVTRARRHAIRVLGSGRRASNELLLRRQDGTSLPSEVSLAAVREEGDQAVGLIVDVRDITERRRHEDEQAQLHAALRKSALEWRRTFDAIESLVLLLEQDGRIRRVNLAARKRAGRPFAEIVHRHLSDLGDGQPWRGTLDLLETVARTGRGAAVQSRDESAGQTWDISATPVAGEGAARVIVVARDITQLVDLQSSLRRSETMSALGSLVAGVAHEVRNPLHSMCAMLDAFEARFGPREEHQRYLRVLRQGLDRLTNLMKELLVYGHPTRPEREDVGLETLVQEVVCDCAALADSRCVRLAPPPCPRDSAVVRVDRPRLADVLRNLIENAVQHTPAGGEVRIVTSISKDAAPQWVECAVEDDGAGFRPEDLPFVFDPFFTRRRGGTGLGLSIVQRIVEQHGGTVWAQNREPRGARVAFRIPCV